MEIEKLVNAINKVTPETKPNWGKMNSSQMLWHCKKFIIFYQNEKKLFSKFYNKNTWIFSHVFS